MTTKELKLLRALVHNMPITVTDHSFKIGDNLPTLKADILFSPSTPEVLLIIEDIDPLKNISVTYRVLEVAETHSGTFIRLGDLVGQHTGTKNVGYKLSVPKERCNGHDIEINGDLRVTATKTDFWVTSGRFTVLHNKGTNVSTLCGNLCPTLSMVVEHYIAGDKGLYNAGAEHTEVLKEIFKSSNNCGDLPQKNIHCEWKHQSVSAGDVVVLESNMYYCAADKWISIT